MSFSSRNSLMTFKECFQIDSMNIELRNSIWNSLYVKIEIFYSEFYDDVVSNFFKEPLDIEDHLDSWGEFNKKEKLQKIKSKFDKLAWNRVYDFIEYIVNSNFFSRKESHIKSHLKSLVESINRVLEREGAAYRLVNGIITSIVNEQEIDEVNEAMLIENYSYESVETHLKRSLDLLSSKTNPDYRNSMKESISAVEAYCRILTNESTLGEALKRLENKGVYINQQLKQAYEKLYAYTNSKDSGIRHAIIENGNEPDFDIAKYFLVMCSAFINLLKSKTS